MSIAPEYKSYATYVESMKSVPKPEFNAAGNCEVALGIKNMNRISDLEDAIKKAINLIVISGDPTVSDPKLLLLEAIQLLDTAISK